MKLILFVLLIEFVCFGCERNETSDKEKAASYYKSAVVYENRDDFFAAAKMHAKAINTYPDIPRAYLDRSIDFSILEMNDRAIKDLDTFLVKVPNAPEAYVWRAEFKRKNGQFESALEDAKKGLQLAGGMVKNITLSFNKTSAFDTLPNQYEIEPGYATYEIAYANYELKNYPEAIEFGRWTLPEIPPDGFMEVVIGCSLLHLDSIAQGCRLLQKNEIIDGKELKLFQSKCSTTL